MSDDAKTFEGYIKKNSTRNLTRFWGDYMLEPKWRSREQDTVSIEAEHIGSFLNYLQYPTREGYWRLTAKWNSSSEFSKYVFEKNKERLINQEERETTTEIEDFSSSLSAAMTVFENVAVKSEERRDPWVAPLTAESMQEKFPAALETYKSSITFKGFIPFYSSDSDLFKIKSGIIFLEKGPRSGDDIVISSLTKQSLIAIGEFYSQIGQFKDVVIDRIFSPEEQLFAPYFSFLVGSFNYVLPSTMYRLKFSEAFTKFKESDYQHCVSTLGLIAEELLIEVYETFLRESCPKGQTLGQINQRLHSRIAGIVAPKKQTVSEIDPIYNALKEIEEKAGEEGKSEALVKIIRDFATAYRKDRSLLLNRIDEIAKPQTQVAIFPEYIRELVSELIGLRNSAAHKTRVPLAKFDALRALYCLMSLLLWWQSERKVIVWENDLKSIIEDSVNRANGTK